MTVKELAKICEVSPAAISIVLNNKPGVSDETRARILGVLKQYNYINSKKKNVTKNLCFFKYKKHGLLVEQNQGFIATILDAIEEESCQKGYNLSIIGSDNNFAETIKTIDFNAYDGIIVLGTELEEEQYACFEDIKKPFVVVDNAIKGYPCNSIAINNNEIVCSAISHLAGLGHKSIGYFHSNVHTANFAERNSAFIEYCSQFNMDFKPEYQFDISPTLVTSYESMKQYLKTKPVLPTCAFADNDTIAIGAIKALLEFGYRVPEDISVVGFDDIHFSAISSPPLTTMRIQKTLIGTLAVRQICDMLENSAYSDVKIKVGAELILRSSTAKYSDD